jgi:Uma2 family endonuclease
MYDVPWETYLSLVELEGRHTRVAYDQGVMEIRSPLKVHERVGCLIGRMVETWTEINDIEIQSVASTTFKRDELSKGFEADESYYIEHADRVRHLEEVDLSIHPGPDLVIEVDITNSSMRKFGIYAGLQVAEIWRWVDEGFRIYVQSGEPTDLDGFVETEVSRVLPGFPFAEAAGIVAKRLEHGETPLIRQFRQTAEKLAEN